MHLTQSNFCRYVKDRFPLYFLEPLVLDVGSLDVNGTNRYLFEGGEYTGIDIGPGPNVDVVSPVHLWKTDRTFTTIISTECFEHDRHYPLSIEAIIRLLCKKGLFIMTCAGVGRPEHGTHKTDNSSPFTKDYYQNLTVDDFMISFGESFERFEFDTSIPGDLYFWGIKR